MQKLLKYFIALMLLLGIFASPARAAENYVVCRVDWLSDSSATVKLEWKQAGGEPLMITGWQVGEGKKLLIYYQKAKEQGFDSRVIEVAKNQLPAQVELIPSGENKEKKAIFKDMPKNPENAGAIQNLYYQGILGGYPDGTFAPEKAVSRAEFAKILCEAIRLPQAKAAKTSFKDIEKNWAKGYILALADKKLVNGKAEGVFDPNGKVTIGEVLALLNRSFYLYQEKSLPVDNLKPHWSNQNYTAMKRYGVVKTQDSIYMQYTPNKPATRAEVALLLSRILEQKHDRVYSE